MGSTGTTSLPPLAAHVVYSPVDAEGTPQQPQTDPIAHFESTPNKHPTGALLDVNGSFIVYGVKGGLVRVLDRFSTMRALLRGHEEVLSDVCFFNNGDVLGTVGGNVMIWRIFHRGNELASEKLLEIRFPLAVRLVWHPFNPNQFFLLHRKNGENVVATLVDTTHITTQPHEKEGHAVCDSGEFARTAHGAIQLNVSDSLSPNVNDLSWSPRDARHVLTAHEDGCLRLWDLKGAPSGSGAKYLMPVQENEDGLPVSRCIFLPHDNVVGASLDKGVTNFTPPFVSGSNNNSHVTLWSPFNTSRAPPTKLRIFSVAGTNLSFGMSICHGKRAEGVAPSTLLILTSMNNGMIHALHLKSAIQHGRFSAVGFDYVITSTVMHPIYSCRAIAHTVPSEEVDEAVGMIDAQLFCVQSKAVQMLALMHYSPPSGLPDGVLPPGVTIPVDSPDKHEKKTSEEAKADAPALLDEQVHQFDEDYDLDEDEADKAEDDDEVDHNVGGFGGNDNPFPSTVPPPPGIAPPKQDSSPFANWLGAIGMKGPSEASATTEFPPPPPPTPAREESTAGLVPSSSSAQRPLSSIPSTPPEEDTAAGQNPSRQDSGFLSPMDLLSSKKTVSKEALVGLDQDQGREEVKGKDGKEGEKKKKPRSRGTSPKRDKKGQNKKTPKGAVPPFPMKEGKISILKREDKEESAAPVAAASSLDIPEKKRDVTSSEGLEAMVQKLITVHLKEHETRVLSKIQSTVKAEFDAVLPTLSGTVTKNVEEQVVKPLKESIASTAKETSKVRTEEVVDALSSKMQLTLMDTFQQNMKEVMIPAYEAATREMFAQVATRLDEGLAKAIANENGNETGIPGSAAQELRSMEEKLESMSLAIQSLTAEVGQLRSAAESTQAAKNVPPGMSAQPPFMDKNQQIRNEVTDLIQRRSYELAFTKALSASTADMAVFACKMASVSDVFSGGSGLSQPILLCLMQQLGAVLVSSTDGDLRTELDWLQEIALTLDPSDESIQKHVGGVLQQLVLSINTKISQSDPASRRPLQMLLQVIRGMGAT